MTQRFEHIARDLISNVQWEAPITSREERIRDLEADIAKTRSDLVVLRARREEQLQLLEELGYAVRQSDGEYVIKTPTTALIGDTE